LARGPRGADLEERPADLLMQLHDLIVHDVVLLAIVAAIVKLLTMKR
jgi:hypothetical protein